MGPNLGGGEFHRWGGDGQLSKTIQKIGAYEAGTTIEIHSSMYLYGHNHLTKPHDFSLFFEIIIKFN